MTTKELAEIFVERGGVPRDHQHKDPFKCDFYQKQKGNPIPIPAMRDIPFDQCHTCSQVTSGVCSFGIFSVVGHLWPCDSVDFFGKESNDSQTANSNNIDAKENSDATSCKNRDKDN